VTVSTSRYRLKKAGRQIEDESGDLAEKLVKHAKGTVSRRELIPDDAKMLRAVLSKALASDLDVVLLTGGTGVSSTDVTVETVRPYFEKEIEGFGEIFRSVSYDRIGAAAALSRATAGVAKGKVIMCLPGSPDAVRTYLDLFLGELPHIIHLTRGH